MGKAYFKQSNGMYAVNIVAACGVLTPEQFIGLGQIAKDCQVFRLKLTTRQTIVAVLDEEHIQNLEQRLPEYGLAVAPYGSAVRSVKACAGNAALCPRALGDALDLGIAIQEKYLGRAVPKDFKIAVAGCPRGCTDPLCADFGLVARGNQTFNVFIGGRGGSGKPVHGQLLVEAVPWDDVFILLDHVLACFTDLAQPKERLSMLIARVGMAPFQPAPGLIAGGAAEPAPDQSFLDFLDTEGSDLNG